MTGPDLEALAVSRLAALGALDAAAGARLRKVLVASDFVFESLRAEPEWIAALLEAIDDARPPPARLPVGPFVDDAQAQGALRRARRFECLRLVARDVLGLDPVADTLTQASALAEALIGLALSHAERAARERHGVPRDAEGAPIGLVVFALGKLGGGELNFSSDVDLVYAFRSGGRCDGPRRLEAEEYFTRLAQRLTQLLAESTVDGFAYRVDLRLRPFGAAGRVALSFAAMEQYFQREGRDWERYAWVKARAIAGDVEGGARFLEQLRPFVYRRYLDFAAIDGLREMKRLIDAEVARQDLATNLKLGPGGIREIEFMVQLVQLVRGGRHAALRTPSLAAALDAAQAAGFVAAEDAAMLRESYAFLRRLENRVQMLSDHQVHALPEDPMARAQVAAGLGLDPTALEDALATHRGRVAALFAHTLTPSPDATATAAASMLAGRWRALRDGEAPRDAREQVLAGFAHGAAVRGLDARAQRWLDRLMPPTLAAIDASIAPDLALARVLGLLQAVAGRPTYLALLAERPRASERVVALLSRSAWLAARVTAHPLLLDELLDARAALDLPQRDALRTARDEALLRAEPDDEEAQLAALHEFKQSAQQRIALAWLEGGAGAVDTAAALADLAALIVQTTLAQAQADAARAFGRPAGRDGGVLAVAYGSLGGHELGFDSDLDLVFLYADALADASTDGARAVEGSRFMARVAQRCLHWLSTPTRAGPLYAVDTRLRPDGAKGLLVSTLGAYGDYQRERAWVWEHQALVRARAVAGDDAQVPVFEAARVAALARPRDAGELAREIATMRERWRAERDRSRGADFDLKQGRGGLVDLEFLLQALVLAHGSSHPGLLEARDSRGLIACAARAGLFDTSEASELQKAHEALLARALACTLDARPRVVTSDAVLDAHRTAILTAAARRGTVAD